jgi:uncharacterized membrane protein
MWYNIGWKGKCNSNPTKPANLTNVSFSTTNHTKVYMTAISYRDPVYFIVMTSCACALLALGFYFNGIISNIALIGAGVYFGHIITEALNQGETQVLGEE